MLHFQKSSLIYAPVKTVWQFHERSDILQLLTPPWQPVQIVRRTGGLGVGALSEFRIWLGPIPVQWVAVHTECVPYQHFVDEQQSGPMAYWRHRHQFEAQGSHTQLTDTIAFALPGGKTPEALMGWWINSRLEEMFQYRHRVTRNQCQHQGTTAERDLP
ncbi:cyclase [Synechococcales cyanobacterium C]|uniref:Cyclase n=1 Tax=Petrachloros mirabilis ULC683 TaxID=2781853 RepID=A0A8K2A7F1_9CYAN|nr:SRPBCC family protein [Petrachloros mirabilis]NCJ06859.1 cyclase [Petrachloros mirabilis ULC683]